jgi:hypothetical protein
MGIGQYGFRKKKILITFLDLEKAFNSISRQLLLNKLKKLGFDENTLKWFTSYLSNRQQLTIIGSNHSNFCYVKDYGVTQGTSLGPYCFYYILTLYLLHY